MPTPTRPHASVTRTLRAALKIGEDYLTIEESITLASDASDADIAAAVNLGWRMYTQQREAIEAQISEARDTYGSDRERPVLPTQMRTIENLQQVLGWDAAHLAQFVAERRYDMSQLTRRQASSIIEQLRRVFDEQQRADGPITKGQYDALQRMATASHIDLDDAIRQHLNLDVPLTELTFGEATTLVNALRHERPRTRKN